MSTAESPNIEGDYFQAKISDLELRLEDCWRGFPLLQCNKSISEYGSFISGTD
ncbi:hypothetical protein [Azospirillum doebereinerae]